MLPTQCAFWVRNKDKRHSAGSCVKKPTTSLSVPWRSDTCYHAEKLQRRRKRQEVGSPWPQRSGRTLVGRECSVSSSPEAYGWSLAKKDSFGFYCLCYTIKKYRISQSTHPTLLGAKSLHCSSSEKAEFQGKHHSPRQESLALFPPF